MADISPIIVAVLGFFTVVCAFRALAGRVDRTTPRCQKCNADARPFGWREPCRCDCGADLRARRSLRWQRRRSVRAVVLAVLLVMVTALFAWWAVEVRSRGVGWRDELPLWAYASIVEQGGDEPFHSSIDRRMAEVPEKRDVARMLDALLASQQARPSSATWRCCQHLASRSIPTGAAGERFLTEAMNYIDVIAEQRENGIEVSLRPIEKYAGDIRMTMIRVDAITIDGRPVPFTTTRTDERSVPNDQGHSLDRIWFPLGDQRGLTRHHIASVSLDDPASLRVSGQLAFAGSCFDALELDEQIATTRDPHDWEVDVATVLFDRAAAAAPGRPEPPETSGGWDYDGPVNWWGRWQGCASMPAAFAVPMVAMLQSGVLAAVAFLLLWPAAAFARGPARLAPPSCRRCHALVRGAHDTLPPRCSECGATLATFDDCRCVTVRSTGIRIAAMIVASLVLAAGSLLLTPRAYGWTNSELGRRFVTPEAEAAWLVRGTIDPSPYFNGPDPANRLRDGSLFTDSGMDKLYQNPAAVRAAMTELLAWWRSEGGTLRSGPDKLTEMVRRNALAVFVRKARATKSIDASDCAEILRWCTDPAVTGLPLLAPLMARAGEPLIFGPFPSEVPMFARGPAMQTWVPLKNKAIPIGDVTQQHAGPMDFDLAWTYATLQNPTCNEADVAIARSLHATVHFVASDAPQAVTGPLLETLAPLVQGGLRVQDCGDRVAVKLDTPELHHLGAWLGRWEVLANDTTDATPLAVLRRNPRGPAPVVLVHFPRPLPEVLFLRFVPELPASALTSPGKGMPMWGGTTTFRVTRRADDLWFGNSIAVYATEACTLLRR